MKRTYVLGSAVVFAFVLMSGTPSFAKGGGRGGHSGHASHAGHSHASAHHASTAHHASHTHTSGHHTTTNHNFAHNHAGWNHSGWNHGWGYGARNWGWGHPGWWGHYGVGYWGGSGSGYVATNVVDPYYYQYSTNVTNPVVTGTGPTFATSSVTDVVPVPPLPTGSIAPAQFGALQSIEDSTTGNPSQTSAPIAAK